MIDENATRDLFFRALATGEMFALTDDLAGPSLFGDSQYPQTFEEIRSSLLATLGLYGTGESNISLQQAIGLARKRFDVDEWLDERRAVPKTRSALLGRIFRAPFRRFYDLSGLVLEEPGLLPAGMSVRTIDGPIDHSVEREVVSLTRYSNGGQRVHFEPPRGAADGALQSIAVFNSELLSRPGLIFYDIPKSNTVGLLARAPNRS